MYFTKNKLFFSIFFFQVQKEINSLRPNTYYKIQLWATNEIDDGEITELTSKTETGKIF